MLSYTLAGLKFYRKGSTVGLDLGPGKHIGVCWLRHWHWGYQNHPESHLFGLGRIGIGWKFDA